MKRSGVGIVAALLSLGAINHVSAFSEKVHVERSQSNETIVTLSGLKPNCSRPDATSVTAASHSFSIVTSTVGMGCWPEPPSGYPFPYFIVENLGVLPDATYNLSWTFAPTIDYDTVATSFTTPAPLPPNYQGLWWVPNGAESGWGISLAHQGDTIFATWFTYSASGNAVWRTLIASGSANGIYSGSVYGTVGPPFNVDPFDPAKVTTAALGFGTLTFTDGNSGTFDVVIPCPFGCPTFRMTKTIARQQFGPLPTCIFGAEPDLAAATNYTDLWWAAPAASESGWGLSLSHQGDTIFAVWFTYDVDGQAMWLAATATKSAPDHYGGTLYRTTGPGFTTGLFDPSEVLATPVGSISLTFADGNHAVFAYEVNTPTGPVAQSKSITREIFASPGTNCQ